MNGEIAAALAGLDPADQRALDETLIALDGTENKGRLGANAILGCSLAAARAGAAEAGVPLFRWLGGEEAATLPVPMLNVVNGGAHAQNSLDLQEFMVVPAGAETFAEALRIGAEVFHALQGPPPRPGALRPPSATRAGSRRTSPPPRRRSRRSSRRSSGRATASSVVVALDPAASEVWRDGRYRLPGEGRELDPADLIDFWASLCERYPDRVDRGSARRGRVGRLEAP